MSTQCPPFYTTMGLQVCIAVTLMLCVGVMHCECARPITTINNNSSSSGNSRSTTSGGKPEEKRVATRTAVILDHDGGVEDLVGMMLLLLSPKVDLVMISYLEADSIKEVAVNTTLKLLHALNRTNTPLAVSTLQPKNQFPLQYRAGPLAADVLPVLNPPSLNIDGLRKRLVSTQPGQDALAELLMQQREPVTIVATGPLTNIAYVLQHKSPAVADKIASIWWMGGALRQHGNVFDTTNSDGSAEWNVFADPQAAAVVWGSKVPLTLVPLDATNKVPITPEFLYKFGARHRGIRTCDKSPLAQIVGAMYAPTVTWVYLSPHDPYYAWDSLNAVCFLQPNICKLQQETVHLVLEGRQQGAMRLQPLISQPRAEAAVTTLLGNSSQSRASSSGSGSVKSTSSHSRVVALSQSKHVVVAVDADAQRFESFVLDAFS